MGDVLFTFDVDATSDLVRRVLTTTEGIASFWTDQADIPAEVGETLIGIPGSTAAVRLSSCPVRRQSDHLAYRYLPSAMGRHRDSVGAFRR